MDGLAPDSAPLGDAPAVSVVLPTYNRQASIADAIGSVLGQTFRDFELIVVDDGSSDGSEAVVRGLADPRIRYLRLPANRGQAAARNAGIRAGRSALVAFQDSDDTWVSDKLALQMTALRQHPDAAMIYGDLLRIPLNGEPFVIRAPDLARGQTFDARPSAYASYGLGIQTCLIRREVLVELGSFDERFRKFEDLELFLRIARNHVSVRVPGVLAHYHETVGVSHGQGRATRLLLLQRYGLPMLRQRPDALMREMANIAFGWSHALI